MMTQQWRRRAQVDSDRNFYVDRNKAEVRVDDVISYVREQEDEFS